MEISFILNRKTVSIDVDENTPLLWVIRDELNLKGTKFGCGKAACGACTVLINGEAIRCCSYPIRLVEGTQVTTIEGLNQNGALHAVQQAWLEEVVPQCGYCQPGFIMAAVALLEKIPEPSDDEIDNEILNLCRCGTYFRMRKAIHRAAALKMESPEPIEKIADGEE
ncbi:MAG: (2Fe-2S)-binding protein [Flavobacteriaceae bacterium]